MVERTFLKIVEGKVNVIRKRILIYELSYTLSFIYILLTVAKWYLIFYEYRKQSELPGYLSRLIRKNVLMQLCVHFIPYISSKYFNLEKIYIQYVWSNILFIIESLSFFE